jgi:hypothetical protein
MTHILNNVHKYGNINNNMSLLKEVNKGSSVNASGQFTSSCTLVIINLFPTKAQEITPLLSNPFTTSNCHAHM